MRAFIKTLAMVLLSLAAGPGLAQYPAFEQKPRPRPHYSPLGPAPAPPLMDRRFDDIQIVVDQGEGGEQLDQYYLKSDTPRIKVILKNRRYVGEVDADGHLKNLGTLVGNGVVTEYALLRFPAYDVDYDGYPPDPDRKPERDTVYFNGKPLGHVRGFDNQWYLQKFRIPISEVKFPTLGGVAENVFEVSIDDLDADWAVGIDWVELKFGAMSPVFMVHGINANHGSWSETDFLEVLKERKIPHEASIDLNPSGTRAENAIILKGQVYELLEKYGASRCHLVCHSKGGLDTRQMLRNTHLGRIATVHTLTTPHHGSTIASVQTLKDNFLRSHHYTPPPVDHTWELPPLPDETSPNPDIQATLDSDYQILQSWGVIPAQPGLGDLAVENLAAFNATPALDENRLPFFYFNADADLNVNAVLDGAEAEKIGPTFLLRPAHSLLGHTMTVRSRIEGTAPPVLVVEPDQTSPGFIANDIVVTVFSAVPPLPNTVQSGYIMGNHTTMRSRAVAEKVANNLLQYYSAQWALNQIGGW